MKLLFLHGLGQRADSWDLVIEALDGYTSEVVDLLENGMFPKDITRMKAKVASRLQTMEEDCVVVGLSLGAMVAASLLEEDLPALKGLVLIAGQDCLKGNIFYLLQRGLFRFFPASFFQKQGLIKENVFSFYRSLEGFDIRSSLASSQLPLTLVCGSKDWPNLLAARRMKKQAPRAQLYILKGVGHEVNVVAPDQLAAVLIKSLESYPRK